MCAETKNRLELIAFCLIAAMGAYWCATRHYCPCGHFDHGLPEGIQQWIEDCIWLFALVASTVLGLRGRFHGARPIGIVCGVIVICMAFVRSPLRGLDGLILAILVFVQVWEFLAFRRNGKAAAQPADGKEPEDP